MSKKNTIKSWLFVVFFVALAGAALIEFITLGLVRKTFVFYAVDSGVITVEERLLKSGTNPAHSPHREVEITRYVEEALLGPVSPDALPLFPVETRLLSLLYRDGVVYANLSPDAVLPPLESELLGKGVFENLTVLYSGIQRNFPDVRSAHFFIGGKAAYPGKFQALGEFGVKKEI